jgi:hypothetical protein
MDIYQTTALVVNPREILEFEWSVPFWDQIMTTDARKGIVRHGGVPNALNHIPREYKPLYGAHVRSFVEERSPARLVLALGFRNTGPNNLGLPGFDHRRSLPLFARVDEPWRSWTYFALVMFRDRSFGLQRVQFRGQNGEDIVLLDDPLRSPDVLWVVTGQPLAWDGLIPSCLPALTYDLRHVWRLSWESHEQARWPECRHHLAAHSALMDAFMTHLNDPVQVRMAAMAEIAARFSLRIQDGYIHSTLGIRENGDLILLIRRGSLAQLGRAQIALGAQRAILLDNGGSPGYAVWAPEKVGRGEFDAPAYIGNAAYFRPRAHSLGILELDMDSLESGAFGPSNEDRDLFRLKSRPAETSVRTRTDVPVVAESD